jgi:uncharacterized coiled-coil protein SlyX
MMSELESYYVVDLHHTLPQQQRVYQASEADERIKELESMLESRTKEVDDWIKRYDKNITKQQKMIQEQRKQLDSLPLDVQAKLARLTKLIT